MRKLLFIVTVLGLGVAVVGIQPDAQAQGMMGGYYGGGYGPGYMMGPGYGGGYGHGYGMMQGYGSGYGPGMMYGDNDQGDYRRAPQNRGDRLCWHSTNAERGYGYYEPCAH